MKINCLVSICIVVILCLFSSVLIIHLIIAIKNLIKVKRASTVLPMSERLTSLEFSKVGHDKELANDSKRIKDVEDKLTVLQHEVGVTSASIQEVLQNLSSISVQLKSIEETVSKISKEAVGIDSKEKTL